MPKTRTKFVCANCGRQSASFLGRCPKCGEYNTYQEVVEEVRKAGKTLSHSVAKDKLGSQIGVAENSGAKYIILLGQKEALENSVVLRHNASRAQEIIPIPELANRLKNL